MYIRPVMQTFLQRLLLLVLIVDVPLLLVGVTGGLLGCITVIALIVVILCIFYIKLINKGDSIAVNKTIKLLEKQIRAANEVVEIYRKEDIENKKHYSEIEKMYLQREFEWARRRENDYNEMQKREIERNVEMQKIIKDIIEKHKAIMLDKLKVYSEMRGKFFEKDLVESLTREYEKTDNDLQAWFNKIAKSAKDNTRT